MCCNTSSFIKSETVCGSVILALEWRSNERLEYKEANVLLPRYNFIILAVNGPESEIRFSFSPAGNTQKRRYVGFFNCASLNFRKWSGNQSKWVILKTGSSVIRQKQTHADPISGTVKQVFVLARKELASTKPPPRSQIWANICCTIYFPNENPWV